MRKKIMMEALPGLKVIRQDLLVQVPSGKIMICRTEGMVYIFLKKHSHILNSKDSILKKLQIIKVC